MDASGHLYQYDNYDEVAMDTDSEAGSPSKVATFPPPSSVGAASKLSTLLTFQPLRPRASICTRTTLEVSWDTLGRYVSPVAGRGPAPVASLHHVTCVSQDFPHPFLSTLSTGTPPPPPIPPPPDLLEAPPKPPFADEEEEEEMLLRETCLMSMVSKRVAVTEVGWTSPRVTLDHVSNRPLTLFLVFVCRRRAVVPLDLPALGRPRHHKPQPAGT